MCLHSNYLTNRQIISSKTGRHFNYFEARGPTQVALYKLGYKYYCKKPLDFFGENVLLKVLETYEKDGETYCKCTNTINFTYYLKASELILNEGYLEVYE